MHKNDKKFAIQLESDKGLDNLLIYLKKEIKMPSIELNDSKKNLRLLKRKFGFYNYEEMLDELERNQDLFNNVVQFLKDLQSSTPKGLQSSTFSIKRKITLKDYINTSRGDNKRKKKKKTRRKIQVLDNNFFSFSLPQDTDNFQSVLNFLSKNNVNYEAYKENYFIRRIQTRLRKLGLNSYSEYYNHLRKTPKEIKLLVSSFSINVTHFFRDRDLFINLQRKVLPLLLDSENVSIWSAGCAIGPEPYSIAMLINRLGVRKEQKNIRILATDLSQEFLRQAKLGKYPQDLLKELDQSEIKDFFFKLENNEFQISDEIKQYVTFKAHDLRTPPPANNFDLILCRNVLIYFSRSQSKELFIRFHHALKPNGFLAIGSCELIHPAIKEKFKIIDSQNRIYRRIN